MTSDSPAIFLSYCSQDEAAARRIHAALDEAGIAVWLDRNELRGGDAWDASIRSRIKECALFVPLISAHTDARIEGYFRLEWRLAVERTRLMADDAVFLLPVAIDDTSEATARVPERFLERQWLRLPGGEPSPEFVARIKAMLAAAVAPAAHGVPAAAPPGMAARPKDIAPRSRWLVPGAVIALLAIAAAGVALWAARPAARAPAATTAGTSAAQVSLRTIAVLPFENLTGRAEDAYLADGLQEEILNALARMRDLRVTSRTSAQAFRGAAQNVREVGRRLGVGAVLEGSVRREGSTLRLTVQLIDARDDRHLLATNYDRDVGRILGLQGEVAHQVAEALRATVGQYEQGQLERVGTNSGDAYDRYLRAVARYQRPVDDNDNGITESAKLLEEAVALDPDYADALALLSQAHTWLWFWDRHQPDAVRARECFERALKVDPALPEARLARGLYQLYVAEDVDRALVDLTEVVRLRPSAALAESTLAFALRRRARFEEALTHQTRAMELDPLNHFYIDARISTLLALRRYTEAIEVQKQAVARFPSVPEEDMVLALIEGFVSGDGKPLAAALAAHGRQLSAADHAIGAALVAQSEGRYRDAAKLVRQSGLAKELPRALEIAFLDHAAGDAEAARAGFKAVARDVSAALAKKPDDEDLELMLALAQSMLGEHAAALATIEKLRALLPESHDPVNGPRVSYIRSIILVRAGRAKEGYAEVERLLRVPFAAPAMTDFMGAPEALAVKDDPHFDALIRHPPRL